MKPFQDTEGVVSYSKVTILSSTTSITEEGEVFEDASSDVSILNRDKSDATSTSSASLGKKMEASKAKEKSVTMMMNKIQTPLFLRKCQKEIAKQGTPPRTVHPILTVQPMSAARKCPSHSILLVSLDSPTYCVRYLQSCQKFTSETVLIFQPPMCYVRFLARPPAMDVVQSKLCEVSETVKLMLSPEKASIAHKMIPKWQTVTLTLAFGKHVAVKYRIIESRKYEIEHVKTKKEKIRIISTKKLYRIEPVQKILIWKPSQVHMLKLTTVEKCDPQLVKKVFLDNCGQQQQQQQTSSSQKTPEITVNRQSELSTVWMRNTEIAVKKSKEKRKK